MEDVTEKSSRVSDLKSLSRDLHTPLWREKKKGGVGGEGDLQIEILTQDVIFYKCIEKILKNVCKFFMDIYARVLVISVIPQIIFFERNGIF